MPDQVTIDHDLLNQAWRLLSNFQSELLLGPDYSRSILAALTPRGCRFSSASREALVRAAREKMPWAHLTARSKRKIGLATRRRIRGLGRQGRAERNLRTSIGGRKYWASLTPEQLAERREVLMLAHQHCRCLHHQAYRQLLRVRLTNEALNGHKAT